MQASSKIFTSPPLLALLLLLLGGVQSTSAQTVPAPAGTVVLSADEYVELVRTLVAAKRRRAYVRSQQMRMAPPPPPTAIGSSGPTATANDLMLDSLELLVRDLERRAAVQNGTAVASSTINSTTTASLNEQRLVLENLDLQRQLDSMVFLANRLERGQSDVIYRSQAAAPPSATSDRTELERLRRELAARDAEMDRLQQQQRMDADFQAQTNRRNEYADRAEIDRLRAEMRQMQDRYENDLRYRNDARRRDRRGRNITVAPAPVIVETDGTATDAEPDSIVYANAETLAAVLNKMDLLEARLAILDGENEARERVRIADMDGRIRDYEAEIGSLNVTIARLEAELETMRNRPVAMPAPAPVIAVPAPAPKATPDVFSYAVRTPDAVVYFANGSSRVEPKFHAELDRIAAALDPFAELQLTVQGFTSKTGSVAVNQRLARERVENVRTYLQTRGVAAERIRTDPVGIDTGAVSNDRARRAEVGLIVVR